MGRIAKHAAMPEEIRTLIDVIGNQTRTEILRLLSAQPMKAVNLAERLGIEHSSVHRNLVKLEASGLVTADVPAGERRGGRQVVWSANAARIAELGAQWVAYASAASESPKP